MSRLPTGKHIERRDVAYRVFTEHIEFDCKANISSERQRTKPLNLYDKTMFLRIFFILRRYICPRQTRYFCVSHKIDIFALQMRYDMNPGDSYRYVICHGR